MSTLRLRYVPLMYSLAIMFMLRLRYTNCNDTELYGMGNSIINWIEQWLTDRRQRVVVDGEVSSWKSVLSGVPQGYVLGPILCLVYINDLEEGVTGKILKFADDTKLFRKVKEIGDKQNLQDDIDKLVKWSEKWQMLFNFGKCKCLHTGSGNTGMNYEMGGTILSKTVKEKDLGVTMNANMKVSEQCRIAASKGNQVLGMIRRSITYKEKSLIIRTRTRTRSLLLTPIQTVI